MFGMADEEQADGQTGCDPALVLLTCRGCGRRAPAGDVWPDLAALVALPRWPDIRWTCVDCTEDAPEAFRAARHVAVWRGYPVMGCETPAELRGDGGGKGFLRAEYDYHGGYVE